MPIFDPSQIIGKTLFAAAPVQVKRLPLDSAPAVFTAAAGQAVGKVYSYLSPGSGRAVLYWQFYDSNGRPYYSAHEVGKYSLTALKQQGAQTVEEQQAAAAAANAPAGEWIKKNITLLIWVIGGAIVLKSVLPALINSRQYANR